MTIDQKHLPEQLKTIIDCIGLDNAIKLSKALGGTVLNFHEKDLLNNIIDSDCIIKVSWLYGKECVYIPKLDKIFIQLRNQQIISARNSKSLRELAIEFKLSSRQIINICNKNGMKRND